MLSTALNTAVQALQANQIGLAVASNNIANINTPGYSRQRAVMQQTDSIGLGGVRIGTGVEVLTTEALRDQLVERRLWNETSQKSASDLTHQSLSDIETLFNDTNGGGFNVQIAQFFNSFQQLSTNPSSPELRQQVLSSAAALTQSINARASNLQDMKTAIDGSVQTDVAKANSLIQQIAATNGRIQETETTQQPANDLRDQRANLVKQLSEIMDVRELDSNGSYQLTTGNNRPLVLDHTAMPLDVSQTSGTTAVLSGNNDITSEFVSGSLAARIALRDTTIPQYTQALDQMAYDLVGQVNALHAVSYDQDGNTGINFFTPVATVAGAARNLQVSPAVAADPRKVAAGSQASGADNRAAIALGNLLNTANPPRGSVADQYRSFVFQIGSDTADSQTEVSQHSAMLTQLENVRAAVSGVSIDEETTRILQFQRAFQASARIISTIDELFQTTLNMLA